MRDSTYILLESKMFLYILLPECKRRIYWMPKRPQLPWKRYWQLEKKQQCHSVFQQCRARILLWQGRWFSYGRYIHKSTSFISQLFGILCFFFINKWLFMHIIFIVNIGWKKLPSWTWFWHNNANQTSKHIGTIAWHTRKKRLFDSAGNVNWI